MDLFQKFWLVTDLIRGSALAAVNYDEQRGWTTVAQKPLICMQSCVFNGVVLSEVAIVWLNVGKHTVHIHTQSSWKKEQKSSVRSASRYEWGYLIYITSFK